MKLDIITQGEKIKSLRKKYDIKQQELSKGHISRNMISMIENDKANLVESTAKFILKNVQELCEKKGVKCEVSLEYLMESAELQAKNIAKELEKAIDETPEKILEKGFKEEFVKAIAILDRYQLREYKANIYMKIGDYYRKTYNYNMAYTYYSNSLEILTRLISGIQLIKMLIKISYCCYKTEKYREAIEKLSMAKMYYSELPLEEGYIVSYNMAISYKKIDEFNLAIKELVYIENTFTEALNSNLRRRINLMNLKGNSYRGIGFYGSAIDVFEEALEYSQNDNQLQLLTLVNILRVYEDINDTGKVLKYIDKTLELMEEYENESNGHYAPDFLYDISCSFYFLKNYEKCKVYLKKAIKEGKKYNNSAIIEEALYKLTSIYDMENDIEGMEELKNELFECLSKKLLLQTSKVSLEFIKFFNKVEKYSISNDMITFIQNI